MQQIEALYRYRIEHLQFFSIFNGKVNCSNYIVSELLHVNDDICPKPHHLTCIVGLRAVYDEIIAFYKLKIFDKIKELKFMTFQCLSAINIST